MRDELRTPLRQLGEEEPSDLTPDALEFLDDVADGRARVGPLTASHAKRRCCFSSKAAALSAAGRGRPEEQATPGYCRARL